MNAVNEETKVLIVATIAWGLRKCSRAIVLVLIFLIAMKPGLIHAVYGMSAQILSFFYTNDICNWLGQFILCG